MEFHYLQSFVIVADLKSFSRAAERLDIVQSAVSHKIKLLEQELGVELFSRTRQQVELTEAGRRFLPEARRALMQLQRAEQVAKDAGAGKSGRFTIGCVDVALWSTLPSIVWLFRSRYPDVDLTLAQLGRTAQISALKDKTIDAGIVSSPMPYRGFETELFLTSPFVVALPANHPLAAMKMLSLRELADEPFILFPESSQARMGEQVRSACAAAGFLPRVVLEAGPVGTILSLVSAGVGVTLVPGWMSGMFGERVVYRDLKDAVPNYELVLAWCEGASLEFIGKFKEIMREIIADRRVP
jgi:DNA-binding transcriptional LysR family regulator